MKIANNAPHWSRRKFMQAASGLWLPEQPPNIVFILADDLGYGDLNCYGGRVLTPNIDALAYGGMRFTCHESAAPVCSASRTALLTGRYAQRLGVRALNSVIFPETIVGLPAVATIA
ncbi:MAG: sulfatase-like hydrolase/transferase, partial [Patescibacteria group bacterium]